VYAAAALTPNKALMSDKISAERGVIITIDRLAHLQKILAF
jgi:hypothetical protein